MTKVFVKEEIVNKIFNLFLIAIASTLFFRKISTLLIIIFSIFCILFCRKVIIEKQMVLLCVAVSAPFLVELLLLWNNSNLHEALKILEKYSSLPVFSILLVGNWKRVDFNSFLLRYAQLTTVIISFLVLRFCWLFPEKIALYRRGEYLWEAGYMLADSFGNHAPKVNLHMSFVTCILIYYILKRYYQLKTKERIINILLYFCAFLSVLLINTRVSLFTLFLGNFLIVVAAFKANFIKANSSNFYFKVMIGISVLFLSVGVVYYKIPYMKNKYSNVTFNYLDKVGKLDEIENPESKVFNSFVTRITVWKAGKELIEQNNLLYGVGSADSNNILYNYYKDTEQNFLYKYKLGIHNQYIESFFKYGIIGFIGFTCFIFLGCYLGIKTKHILIFVFGLNIVISNIFDSFITNFIGIVYTGLFLCVFITYYLQRQAVLIKSN